MNKYKGLDRGQCNKWVVIDEIKDWLEPINYSSTEPAHLYLECKGNFIYV